MTKFIISGNHCDGVGEEFARLELREHDELIFEHNYGKNVGGAFLKTIQIERRNQAVELLKQIAEIDSELASEVLRAKSKPEARSMLERTLQSAGSAAGITQLIIQLLSLL